MRRRLIDGVPCAKFFVGVSCMGVSKSVTLARFCSTRGVVVLGWLKRSGGSVMDALRFLVLLDCEFSLTVVVAGESFLRKLLHNLIGEKVDISLEVRLPALGVVA